ncbi:hypothetical protein D918_03377 [Trichuris suis]|nr:hypothetical protein D918_03377 [Trichuris suis]
MVEQYARDTFHKDISRQQSFDYWYDQLSQLPIYFSRFTGFTKLKSLVEMIEYHASAQDIQHVVIDNALLITEQGQKSVFAELKRLALAKHLHITAVGHPRQEFEDGVSLASSLQGTLEGAYDADNILRISTHMSKRQSYELEKYFQIWKNRNAGELLLGYMIEMHFDPLSKCHSLVERKRKSKHAFNN